MKSQSSRSISTYAGLYSVAWPLIVNGIMFASASVIDTILVTPLGETSLAAMGLATAVGGLILGIMFSFAGGGQILVAQAFGANDNDALKSSFWISVANLGLIALAGTVLFFLGGEYLISLFAETQEMASFAYDYLTIFTLVIWSRVLSGPIITYFNGCGETKLPMYSYLIELPINVALSYALIYGYGVFPELGITGAAYGSAVATWMKSIFLTVAMYLKKPIVFKDHGWVKKGFFRPYKLFLDQATQLLVFLQASALVETQNSLN